MCLCVDVYVNLLYSYNIYIYRLDRGSEGGREGWEQERNGQGRNKN